MQNITKEEQHLLAVVDELVDVLMLNEISSMDETPVVPYNDDYTLSFNGRTYLIVSFDSIEEVREYVKTLALRDEVVDKCIENLTEKFNEIKDGNDIAHFYIDLLSTVITYNYLPHVTTINDFDLFGGLLGLAPSTVKMVKDNYNNANAQDGKLPKEKDAMLIEVLYMALMTTRNRLDKMALTFDYPQFIANIKDEFKSK